MLISNFLLSQNQREVLRAVLGLEGRVEGRCQDPQRSDPSQPFPQVASGWGREKRN